MAGKSLSVVVLSYNTRDLLGQCLAQFYEQLTSPQAQLIVVDNGSIDGTGEMVRTGFPSVELVSSPENLGYAGGNNLGLRRATGRTVILLNSDVLAPADVLAALAHTLEQQEKVGALSAGLVTPEHKPQTFAYGDDPTLAYIFRRGMRALLRLGPLHRWDVDGPIEVGWVSGACMAVRQEVIQQVGLLDERFFLYFEDVDWCLRMRRAGWGVAYDPRLKVIHFGGASEPQRHRANRLYYQSMLAFYQKHYGSLAALILRLLIPLYSRLAR